MLTASFVLRRSSSWTCAIKRARVARHVHQNSNGKKTHKNKKTSVQEVRRSGNGIGQASENDAEQPQGPSLYEQLFPDQGTEARQKQEQVVPRVLAEPPPLRRRHQHIHRNDVPMSEYEASLRRQTAEGGTQTSVLVLRNASQNLVEEDFRRLVPHGEHMEGWTLEQGDILKVIPGRDMVTLEQENYYYLLFSSPLSAFTYQGHVTRVHRLVAEQTPRTVLAPIYPPPGYMHKGMDARQAIESFSLIPPNQDLDLRQLRPPFSELMKVVVRHKGYPGLVKRKDRMPFEVRLTLEGPQLHLSRIRHVFMLSGKDRGLSWSGNSKAVPQIIQWEPSTQDKIPSPMSNNVDASRWGAQQRKHEWREVQDADALAQWQSKRKTDENEAEQRKRRKSQLVYIVGFQTAKAMQSFTQFWHRRPMEWEGLARAAEDGEDDLAPIANVEVLW